jgi:hypothetical protein
MQHDKFVDSISATIHYHIHIRLDAESRDSTQFQHKISRYARDVEKKDTKKQFDAIYETYIRLQGIEQKIKILEIFLSKYTSKKLSSADRLVLFGSILSSVIEAYLTHLARMDGDLYFTNSKPHHAVLMAELKKIVLAESVKIGYSVVNKTGRTVPANQYESLLKKYNELVSQPPVDDDTISQFLMD